jgi:hypothetical protein
LLSIAKSADHSFAVTGIVGTALNIGESAVVTGTVIAGIVSTGRAIAVTVMATTTRHLYSGSTSAK